MRCVRRAQLIQTYDQAKQAFIPDSSDLHSILSDILIALSRRPTRSWPAMSSACCIKGTSGLKKTKPYPAENRVLALLETFQTDARNASEIIFSERFDRPTKNKELGLLTRK